MCWACVVEVGGEMEGVLLVIMVEFMSIVVGYVILT